MIDKIRQVIEKEYSNTLGIVVYKSGKIVLEEYFSQAHREESVHTFSMVKSIVALLVGIAIDKGFIKGVDQKVIDFFPDYKLKRNQEQLKEVTIENFLTMTVPYKYKSEPWTKVCTSQDWGGKILEMIGGKEQIGERFHYSTLGIQVLSNILTIATGLTLKNFAEKYLFEPLGINNVPTANVVDRASQEAFYKTRNNRGWVKDPSDFYTTGWGLSLTTDEFARIGVMVLNKGVYNGKRILSQQYIEQMLVEREDGYGYLWWIYPKNKTFKIIRKEYNTGKYDSFCANGVGGSLMAVVPEIDTVICMTCSLVYNPKARMELINEYIIPYIEKL
ncbi:MAG: serine hydrolase [Acutalibacteraceae bacterium]|nr:serine hydrolase [Acutalibacteraceae bacterium]